jgi:hypothetical protein
VVAVTSVKGPRAEALGRLNTVPGSTLSDSNHHGSHRELLGAVRISAPTDGWVDVLAVPSSRPVGYLREVVRLTQHLGCLLLVLASGRCSGREVVDRYGGRLPRQLLAIDIPSQEVVPHEWLQFATDRIAAAATQRRSDISLKRNYALLLARAVGARRLLFLDDDIVVPDWVDVLRGSGALSHRFHAVGMDIKGFPDNSVVCHANRLTGGEQDTFVGGGALMLNPQRVTGFFPNVYNEDWFFLLERAAHRLVGIAGVAAQRPYDPFATPIRAEREEFGDVLAEGLFWLLDEGRPAEDADEAYWREALNRRGRLISQVIERRDATPLPPDGWRRMVAALTAADRARQAIEPSVCASYVQAWREDRAIWADRMRRTRTNLSLREALAQLGLKNHHHCEVDVDAPLAVGPRGRAVAVPDPLANGSGRPLWVPATPVLLATARRAGRQAAIPEAQSELDDVHGADSTVGVGLD